jgi:predicted Zn-dependent peptidase
MAALDELYGLGFDHYKTMEDAIKLITPADVKRVTAKYFQQPYVLATVRPAAKI